jgi:hypothetical protein
MRTSQLGDRVLAHYTKKFADGLAAGLAVCEFWKFKARWRLSIRTILEVDNRSNWR